MITYVLKSDRPSYKAVKARSPLPKALRRAPGESYDLRPRAAWNMPAGEKPATFNDAVSIFGGQLVLGVLDGLTD